MISNKIVPKKSFNSIKKVNIAKKKKKSNRKKALVTVTVVPIVLFGPRWVILEVFWSGYKEKLNLPCAWSSS
jgi:hypothetical protein